MRISEGKKRSHQSVRLALTERDTEITKATYRFQLLSRDQYIEAGFFGSVTAANTRLRPLVETQILQRKIMPIYPGHGSAQTHYFLGKGSATVLDVCPAVIAQQIRQIARWELRQVEHVRAANQVLLSFIAALRHAPDAELIGFRTEPELRRTFLDCDFAPDGWIDWVALGRHFNCFFEVDLHHEGLTVWREKIAKYRRYAESGGHGERFGFGGFRVLVLAKSAARIQNLRQIASTAGRLFLFAELSSINFRNVLLPVWLPAKASPPLALTEA